MVHHQVAAAISGADATQDDARILDQAAPVSRSVIRHDVRIARSG